MSSGPTTVDAETADGGDGSVNERPRVLLLMGSGRNRQLLVDTLGDRYRVEASTESDALETQYDCCVLDHEQFGRNAEAVRSRRDAAADVALPFVLLAESSTEPTNPDVWEYVDDVISMPVPREALVSRVANLVEKRRTAVELDERTAELEATVAELRTKERAIDAAPVGITMSDATREDNPITYVNERFEELTGYDGGAAIGHNHRMLQGADTDPGHAGVLREAIDGERHASVDILNYRADGQRFWNRVEVSPVRDESGAVTSYVGFQRDITERKLRERRLEVLNRVLSHNLRNKMNVIEGHADLLARDFDGDPPDSLHRIRAAAADLGGLADTVREIEQQVFADGTDDAAVDLAARIGETIGALDDRFPGATVEFEVRDDGPHEVGVTGITRAVEEAVENALEHNDSGDPTVEVRLGRRPDGWIEIEVEDDGPGIPEQELQVLRDGETPLRHADRLGFWLMHWVVSRAGGEFSVAEARPSGSLVTLSVPAEE